MNVLLCPSNGLGSTLDEVMLLVKDDGSGLCRHVDLALAVGNSYGYTGYALDQVEIGDAFITADQYPGDALPGLTFTAQIVALFYELESDFGTFDESIFDNDLPVDSVQADAAVNGFGGVGTGGGDTLLRLKEGIERFFITDINNPAGSAQAQSELPIMWDMVTGRVRDEGPINPELGVVGFNHVPGGANTLYMDGHVEFNKYPSGKFPAHSAAASAIGWG
jgi:prepilin-type processing-associated H-X9-DG protein